MNKKVKTLSSLRVQLIERVKLAESDKSRLMAIVKEEILTEVDLDEATQKAAIMNAESAMKAAEDDANVNGNATVGGDSNANANGNTQNGGDTDQQQTKKQVNQKIDEIAMLQLAWRAADERNQFALQQIQSEYKVIAMQCQAEVEKVKQANEAEKEKLRAELSGDGANNANASMNGNANVDADVESLIKAAVEDTERKHSEQIASLRAELEKAQNSRSATTTSENDNEDVVSKQGFSLGNDENMSLGRLVGKNVGSSDGLVEGWSLGNDEGMSLG